MNAWTGLRHPVQAFFTGDERTVSFASSMLETLLGMKRIAVFGNAGGGKSTLAKSLAAITGLPLFVLDTIQFRDGRYWPKKKTAVESRMRRI